MDDDNKTSNRTQEPLGKSGHPALQALSDNAWKSLLVSCSISDESGVFRLNAFAAQASCTASIHGALATERCSNLQSGYDELERKGFVFTLLKNDVPFTEIWFPHWRKLRHVHQTEIVYFAKSYDGYVKIGKSDEPERRIAQLQTGNPQPIRLIGWLRSLSGFEVSLHRLHEEDRVSGEWFRHSDHINDTISRLVGAT